MAYPVRPASGAAATTLVLTACFELLSQVVRGGGVLCWVRLFVFRVRSCGGVCFGVLCTNASF
jgi:hypothetical protein